MTGARNGYIYQLFNEKGELVEQGTAKQLALRHFYNIEAIYIACKNETKIDGCTVKKVRKMWKPEYNGKYWYVTGDSQYEAYFKTTTDVCRYYVGNCFGTKEEAQKNRDRVFKKLEKYYMNT